MHATEPTMDEGRKRPSKALPVPSKQETFECPYHGRLFSQQTLVVPVWYGTGVKFKTRHFPVEVRRRTL